jgi:hypothetical protein
MGSVVFIAHRGNYCGPNPARENAPDYIDEARDKGFDVEVDLRKVGDQFFLGHDYPQYPVSWSWINDRRSSLLIHLKDFEAAKAVTGDWRTFCHSNDPYTRTSDGLLWLHDISLVPDDNTIVPLMTRELIRAYKHRDIYAICSDWQVSLDGKVYDVPRGTM